MIMDYKDRTRLDYIANAVVDKARADIKEALMKVAEETVDEVVKSLEESFSIDGEANYLIQPDKYNQAVDVIIRIADTREKSKS